jgi:hypothetical protein
MSVKKLSMTVFLVLIGFGLLTAKLDSGYKSYEIKEKKGNTMYVIFRINIPYTIQYLDNKVSSLKKKLDTAEKGKKKLQTELSNYSILLTQLKNNKVKKVCVFGGFNSWKTFASDKPNLLKPGSGNPDTWYTSTAVPFLVSGPGEQQFYKFVLDIGKKFTVADGSEVEYLYVEDPLNSEKTGDGFGGYNSILISK